LVTSTTDVFSVGKLSDESIGADFLAYINKWNLNYFGESEYTDTSSHYGTIIVCPILVYCA